MLKCMSTTNPEIVEKVLEKAILRVQRSTGNICCLSTSLQKPMLHVLSV